MGGDSYRYDRLGRVTLAAVTMPGGEAWSYGTSYDAFGNIEVQSATGPQSSSMMMIPVDSWSNRVDGAEYDWSGNLTAMTYGMESTTYDPLGRVAGYSPVSARDQSYGYDASGERVVSYGVSPQGDPELRAVYTVRDLLGRPIREYRSSPTSELEWSRDHVFLGRNAIASEASTAWGYGGQPLHHHRDHLGSLRLLTRPDKTVVVEQAFEPFGAAWAQTEEPLQFTGHEREAGFGWDYMHARYYTPEWGRFWSVDPIGGTPGMPQSWNAYAYVMGNPVNLFDPWGMECTQSSDGQIRCDGGEITVTAEYEVTTIPIPYWGPTRIPGRSGSGFRSGATPGGNTAPDPWQYVQTEFALDPNYWGFLTELPVQEGQRVDYVCFNVGAGFPPQFFFGVPVGAHGALQVNRDGSVNFGLGPDIGRSAWILSGPVVVGTYDHGPVGDSPPGNMSISYGGGAGLGGYRSINAIGPNSTEFGVVLPHQAGVAGTFV